MNGIEDYKAFLTKVSEEAGIPAFKPSEDGLVSMRVDDAYNVNFQFVEATGKFGKDTAGGYFSLEPETETVVYSYFFDLETAANDIEEFIHTIEKILQLCDLWAERIKGDMSADGAEKPSDSSEMTMGHAIFRA